MDGLLRQNLLAMTGKLGWKSGVPLRDLVGWCNVIVRVIDPWRSKARESMRGFLRQEALHNDAGNAITQLQMISLCCF
ncbi:MAG: hypothetical protein HOA75_00130 [Deltaproteobacteria bacterium]|nr:hypothetical protein [Deltaproteobacteria bacterium]